MTEPGETDDFSVLEHVLTIERHLGAPAVRLRHLQHDAGAGAPGGGVSRRTAALPIVTGTFELNALERLGVEPIGVPLVSEHPGGQDPAPSRTARARRSPRSVKASSARGAPRAEAGGL